jgi:hypothetical protein
MLRKERVLDVLAKKEGEFCGTLSPAHSLSKICS